jgi:hypothetical protein
MPPRIVKVPCPACAGSRSPECSRCRGRGKVQGFCPCGMPGDLLSGQTPVCHGCAAKCSMCTEPLTPDDSVPLSGGMAHVECALVAERLRRRRNLEGPVGTDNSVPTNQCVSERVNQRETPMPRPTEQVMKKMAEHGFIFLVDAARLSGHPPTTLYDWVAAKKLKGMRAGVFHFVELASLRKCAPIVAVAAPREPEAA